MANKPVLTAQQQSAFNDALLSGIKDKDMTVIRLALDNGAEPNLLLFAGIEYKKTWKDDFSAAAGTEGFGLQWVKMALEAGADVHARQNDNKGVGWEAIHWAQSNFIPEISDVLIEKGASVDTPSPYNATTLMNAVTNGHAEQIRYYLEKGADPMRPCGENKDSFPFKALQDSVKFKKGAKTELLTLMMQKAKARADAAAEAVEAAKAPESPVALRHDIEVSAPLELKHAAAKSGKSFSL